jgi:predicted dehydrogenase
VAAAASAGVVAAVPFVYRFYPEAAAAYARLPAGHPQGYQDCFTAFVADVYAAIGGQKPDGLPMFTDGLRAAVLTAAVVESTANSSWVEVPT